MRPLRFLGYYIAIKLVEVWVFALRDVLREERRRALLDDGDVGGPVGSKAPADPPRQPFDGRDR